MGKLNALKVKSLGPGRHADGDGLYLFVKQPTEAQVRRGEKSGARSWVLRIQYEGQRRDLGLGAVDTSNRATRAMAAAEAIPLLQRRLLTLAEARGKADAYRRMVKAGVDPVAERAKIVLAVPTFEKAARACHEELKAGWRNKKHSESWLACLVNYVFPKIGKTPVDAVDSLMVRDLLAPIWMEKAETSKRILQRIGTVLDYSHIKGWRPTETTLKSVRKGLPRQAQSENHFEAMPYQDVPAFMRSVAAEAPTIGRDALRFTVLTAVRSNETRFATWPEFNLERGTWTIPSTRMKMNQTHVVPLAPAVIEILLRHWQARTSDDGLVFSSSRTKPAPGEPARDRPISDMTMTKVLRDHSLDAITVHGFRSSFTDWAAETTSIPKEVVDKALAHKLSDRVEAAYRRTDFFDRRRVLMMMWADFCGGVNNAAQPPVSR